ncbi:hypothetical protein ABT008_10130 [Micromonospora sp. NPDC002389]|uniref:hypothetical protein n=1 Tax=Micromonospora sp. NPDC002389 TaxID=3154272 RepID=UPI00332459C4
MLIQELLPLFGTVTEIVDSTPERLDLRRLLRIPDEVRYTAREGRRELDPGQLLVVLVGANPPQTDPAGLPDILAPLRTGAQALLLLGWAIDEIPSHRLVDPLVRSGCQVMNAVPLDRPAGHGADAAIVAQRVDRLTAPRPYLLELDDDGPLPQDGGATVERDGGAADRFGLRMANEWHLTDLVSRPLRRRLREQEAELATLRRQLAEQTARNEGGS